MLAIHRCLNQTSSRDQSAYTTMILLLIHFITRTILIFRSTLSLGFSKPWPEVMETMTGQQEISTEPLKRYFSPLFAWLKDYRKTHKYPIGW